MKIETVSLPFYRYSTEENLPTCAASFSKGQVCTFYSTYRFGTHEICGLTNETLYRRNEGIGTLIPLDSCPLWKLNETQSSE